jgi:hypothetical protein
MIRVSFYRLATGEITRRAMLHPDLVSANLADGEGALTKGCSSRYFEIIDADVEMHAVLDDLGFGHPLKGEVLEPERTLDRHPVG